MVFEIKHGARNIEHEVARVAFSRQGKWLEYVTIGWNSLEGLLSIFTGLHAGSIALVGFGIDSFIEVTSAGAMLWRMSVDHDVSNREENERRALRLVGGCFIALAMYISIDAGKALFRQEVPKH